MQRLSLQRTHRVLQSGIFLLAIAVGLVWRVGSAEAATLYLSPASGTYSVNETITVGVYVSSSDQAINATSAEVTFPPSIVTIKSITKAGSIINLWATEPSYSNSIGDATLEGIVLNPGYTGKAGRIATITFVPHAEGEAVINLAAGSVLANDGLGTETFTGGAGATFTIHDVTEAPVVPPSTTTPPAATTTVTPVVPPAVDVPVVPVEEPEVSIVPTVTAPPVTSAVIPEQIVINAPNMHIATVLAVIAVAFAVLLLLVIRRRTAVPPRLGGSAWPKGVHLPRASAVVPKFFEELRTDLFATTNGRIDPAHLTEVLAEIQSVHKTFGTEIRKAEDAIAAMIPDAKTAGKSPRC